MEIKYLTVFDKPIVEVGCGVHTCRGRGEISNVPIRQHPFTIFYKYDHIH